MAADFADAIDIDAGVGVLGGDREPIFAHPFYSVNKEHCEQPFTPYVRTRNTDPLKKQLDSYAVKMVPPPPVSIPPPVFVPVSLNPTVSPAAVSASPVRSWQYELEVPVLPDRDVPPIVAPPSEDRDSSSDLRREPSAAFLSSAYPTVPVVPPSPDPVAVLVEGTGMRLINARDGVWGSPGA